MRLEPTLAEARLWPYLRADRLGGAKFRHQVVIGRYIADFACRTPCKLVIELDGRSHEMTGARDEARTGALERLGYRVLRFGNDDVMRNLDGVLATIGEALRDGASSTLYLEGRGGYGRVAHAPSPWR